MLLSADTHQRAILSILDWVVDIKYLARYPRHVGLPFHPLFFQTMPASEVQLFFLLIFAAYAVLCPEMYASRAKYVG